MDPGQDLQIARFARGRTIIQSGVRVIRAACFAMLAYSVASGLARSARIERSTPPSVGREESAKVTRSLDAATAQQSTIDCFGSSQTLTPTVVCFVLFVRSLRSSVEFTGYRTLCGH